MSNENEEYYDSVLEDEYNAVLQIQWMALGAGVRSLFDNRRLQLEEVLIEHMEGAIMEAII